MQNNYVEDLYKSLIEKNASFSAALRAKSDYCYGNNGNNLIWPGYDAPTVDLMLQYSPTIESKIGKFRNDPDKIITSLHQMKHNCKRYRLKAISIEEINEAFMFQAIIDDMIDPLIDCCSDSLLLNSRMQSETSIDKVFPGLIDEKANESNIDVSTKLDRPYLQQIVCTANAKQTEDFWKILTEAINPCSGKPFMTKEQFNEFKDLNFAIFEKPGYQKYFDIGPIVKSTLTYFVFQFYLKYGNDSIDNKIYYAMLLISNFERFANEKPDTLLSNMSNSKKPKNKKNVINTDKYFSRR